MKNITLLILLSILIVCTAASFACAKLSQQETYTLFNQANSAFHNANSASDYNQQQQYYQQAVLSFEKIIDQAGIKNAKLYYNLANAYLLKGDIGKAILNYRRAEKLDSADANIQKNLAFARSRRLDKVQLKTQKKVLHTLFFWHYDFSVKTRFVLSSVSFAILCVSLTALIWFGRSAALLTTAGLGVILFLCFSISIAVQAGYDAQNTPGVIVSPSVMARQGDGQNYPPSFKEPLHAGTEFDLIEHRAGWLHIGLADGTDAWITKDSAETL